MKIIEEIIDTEQSIIERDIIYGNYYGNISIEEINEGIRNQKHDKQQDMTE